MLWDPQVFGVVASFPAVFVCASLVSALVILALLQVTLNQTVIAVSSALAANLTALLIGSVAGPRWETWYRTRQGDGIDKGFSDTLGRPAEKKKQEEESRLLPTLEAHVDETQPRNVSFFVSLSVVMIIANGLGMLWGSYCAQNFPSRLDNGA